MTLTLRIENETRLPDGGPLSMTIQGQRGIDIGRDSHLDWTLPDPTRFISGKHCEVRFRDGGYWLHDVSTNGTFLNGDDHRMQAPHHLRDGDRFVVGNYVVAVAIEGEQEPSRPAPPNVMIYVTSGAVDYREIWASGGDIPPPIDPKQLRTPPARAPNRTDFLDWAADVPTPAPSPTAWPQAPAASRAATPAAPQRDADMDWAHGRPSREAHSPPPLVQMPAPRRRSPPGGAENPWDDAAAAQDIAPSPVVGRTPNPTPAPPVGDHGSPADFLRQFAAAAGLPENQFDQSDPDTLARELGTVLCIVADNLMQLLSARAQAKQMARSSSHTVIQAINNNPLKFAPTAREALRIMFGPPSESYLDSQRAFETSFDDLKKHQIKTYAAMQHALKMLMNDLGPEAIEKNTEEDRGLSGVLASRKAKLWDAYVARWQAKVRQGNGAPIEAFMLHFAEYYDRDGG